MSDVNSVSNGAQVLEKRIPKPTEKGIAMYKENRFKTLKTKSKNTGQCINNIKDLMSSNGNVTEVQSELNKLQTCFDEMSNEYDAYMKFPLTEEEVNEQQEWFERKVKWYNDFTEDVKQWLCEAGQISQTAIGLNEADDIGPNDSVSNITSRAKSRRSQTSRTSTTSSALIKAQAEKAALLERAAALKKQHELQAQEEIVKRQEEDLRRQNENIRRQREQLTLDTELAAFNAKICVLEEKGSRVGSKISAGMHSYY